MRGKNVDSPICDITLEYLVLEISTFDEIRLYLFRRWRRK